MDLELHYSQLCDRIAKAKTSPHYKPDQYRWMEELAKAIKSVIDKPNAYANKLEREQRSLINEIDMLTDIIKKQALIIDISGIQYPTIGQTLPTIWDAYLASRGRIADIGNLKVPNKIQINFI